MAKTTTKSKTRSTKKPGAKRFDRRHELLADEIVKDIENGVRRPAKEIMIQAGYSPKTAMSKPKRALSSESLKAALLERGVDATRITQTLDEAMGANTVVAYRGNAIETDAPDHKTRLQAVSMIGDFFGMKKTVTESRNLNINVNATDVFNMLNDNNAEPSEE